MYLEMLEDNVWSETFSGGECFFAEKIEKIMLLLAGH